jgi:hypothetical protein
LGVVGLLGVVAALALTHDSRAANPQLFGNVGPGYTISLTDSNHTSVTNLPAGTYDITVTDQSSAHDFDLQSSAGVTVQSTDIAGTGTVTWTVTLTNGNWTFLCDAHPTTMKGSFSVGTSSTTGTTSTPGTTGTTSTTGTTGTTGTISTTGTTVTGATTGTAATTAGSTGTTGTAGTRGTAAKKHRCVVPRLVGRKLARARAMTTRAGCRLGRVKRAYSTRFARDRVLAQRPSGGRRVARGTRVNVTVGRGPRR